MTREELIDALRKAEGGTFMLDVEMTRLFLPKELLGRQVTWWQDGGYFCCKTKSGKQHIDIIRVQPWTVSFNPALELLARHKPALDVEISFADKKATVYLPHETMADSFDLLAEETAATPILALCAAALVCVEV